MLNIQDLVVWCVREGERKPADYLFEVEHEKTW